jgi:hypothetical protein
LCGCDRFSNHLLAQFASAPSIITVVSLGWFGWVSELQSASPSKESSSKF